MNIFFARTHELSAAPLVPNEYFALLFSDFVDEYPFTVCSGVYYDKDRNIVLVGETISDAGNIIAYIIKLDYAGNLIWQNQYIDDVNIQTSFWCVAIDNNGDIYVENSYFSDTNVAMKIDGGNGDIIWQYLLTDTAYYRNYNPPMSSPAFDSAGNVYFYSIYDDPATYIKISPNGSTVDFVSYATDTANSYQNCITIDSANNFYMSMSGFYKWDSAMNFISGKSFFENGYFGYLLADNYCTLPTPDGGVVCLTPFAVLKYDSSNNLEWTAETNNFNNSYTPYSLALDPSGNIYVAATNYNTGQLVITKLDPDSNVVWQTQLTHSQYYLQNPGSDFWNLAGNAVIKWINGELVINFNAYGNSIPPDAAGIVQIPDDGSKLGTYGNWTYEPANYIWGPTTADFIDSDSTAALTTPFGAYGPSTISIYPSPNGSIQEFNYFV